MQLKTFTVPFSEIVPADALELAFDESDFVVIRPIYGQPVADIRGLQERLTKLTAESTDDEADQLILDLLKTAIVGWNLAGPTGPIPMPTSSAELNALPSALRGALFPFLTSYRGKGPNPTTAG